MDYPAEARWSIKTKAYGALLVALSAFVGLSVATQKLAESFNYSTSLGEPIFARFYSPTKAISWSAQIPSNYNDRVSDAWTGGATSFGVVLFLGVAAFVGMTYTRRRNLDGHGTARWANRPEIVKSGLLDGKSKGTSIIVGGWREKDGSVSYLAHSGPESCLLFAPSRSGKGVALVVPILLSYTKSCLVLDVKGELWTQTAGYRKKELGNRVLYHDPSSLDEGNARFNPIEEIRIGTPLAVKDAQMIAEYVIPSSNGDKGGGLHDHFEKAARSLVVGVILYECYKHIEHEHSVSITSILSVLSDPDNPPRDYFEDMRRFDDEDCSCLNVISETASEMLNREEREFSSVLSSVITPLTKFRDPILAAATSQSDFSIMQLVDHEDPVTLYLTIRPSDRDVLSSYFALIVNLVCRRMTEKMPDEQKIRHELLLMLDEFSSLPALPIVQQSMDVMPGYGIKAFIVLQDYETLKRLYTESETISSNCKVTVAYTPGKYKTAELLSSMVGMTTVQEKTLSRQKKMINVDGKTENEGVHSRALLTPDEIMRLPVPKIDEESKMLEPGSSLVFSRGTHPIRAVQTPWFFDEEMSRRATIGAPDESDRLNG